MKLFKFLIWILTVMFLCSSFVYASEQPEYTAGEVQMKLLNSESELRKNVKKWTYYINQLWTILGALQSNTQQLNKILERMQMLKSPERFEKMSSNAQLLIDYIYYKILFLQVEHTLIEEEVEVSRKVWGVSLDSFPQLTNPWKDWLNVKVSQMGYSMLYFNTETGKISYPITLKDMQFSGTGIHQDIAPFIDAGVYIAGYLNVTAPGEYSFTLSQSWWETQVILDNRLILDTLKDSDISIYLETWKYLLELQYVNNSEVLDVELNIWD